MASMSYSPVVFSGTSAASDLLRSMSNGVSGVPLRVLGRARFCTMKRNFTITAMIPKGNEQEYPWPADPDPNVKGGILSHLSYFKPLQEKPKPVTLDFEKPLLGLQKQILDVQKMAEDTGLDMADQLASLEDKYQQALKDLYTHMTPIQRVSVARHPNRPTFLDHVFNITDKFVELHGDRAGYDDPAIVTGIGTIDGKRYMFIGHQKGRNTKENIKRNFGMPTPQGYRKALRMMRYADHHGFPIITFIDTPGAYADLKSEELGQGEAIAQNLRTMFGLKVPIISIVIGEGGSGGALAIGCANKLLMLENAVFYVASPEACAAILWKTSAEAPKAAECLRITSGELHSLQIADGIIPEPLGGAHADPSWTSQQIKIAIAEAMDEFTKMETRELLQHRMLKFRKIGVIVEGVPVDPEKKFDMKERDEPYLDDTEDEELEADMELEADEDLDKVEELIQNIDANLEGEVEELKQKILKAKESGAEFPESDFNEMIETLQEIIEDEYLEALEAMGLEDTLVMLQEEYEKASNSQYEILDPALVDKITKLQEEFKQGLSEAPNYQSLMHKIDMLDEICKTKISSNMNPSLITWKEEINKTFKGVFYRADIKEKVEALLAETENLEMTKIEDLDDELIEKIVNVKKEIELELADALIPLGLDVEVAEAGVESEAPALDAEASAVESVAKSEAEGLIQETISDFESKINELNEGIYKRIEDVVNSSDLKSKIGLLKLELVKARETPNLELNDRIIALHQEIRQTIAEAMKSSELVEKFEKLNSEINESIGGYGGLNEVDSFKYVEPAEAHGEGNGGLTEETPEEDSFKYVEPAEVYGEGNGVLTEEYPREDSYKHVGLEMELEDDSYKHVEPGMELQEDSFKHAGLEIKLD